MALLLTQTLKLFVDPISEIPIVLAARDESIGDVDFIKVCREVRDQLTPGIGPERTVESRVVRDTERHDRPTRKVDVLLNQIERWDVSNILLRNTCDELCEPARIREANDDNPTILILCVGCR